MGFGTQCTERDLVGILTDMADELSLSTYSEKKIAQMAKAWLRHFKDEPFPRVQAAAKRLLNTWDRQGMPKARDLKHALRMPAAPTEAVKEHNAWYEGGLHGPCPCCGRKATYPVDGRFNADCDPRAHYDARVPLIGCHPFIHSAATEATAKREPWPHYHLIERKVLPLPTGPLQLPPAPETPEFEEGDAMEPEPVG